MKTPARRRKAAIGVAVTDARGRRISGGAAAGLGAWLVRSAPASARGLVNIAIVPDTVMRRLNRQYRKKDRATDVLSFVPERPLRRSPANARHPFLGDLAIARGVASRQARERGHSLRLELRVLALHGLLHLLGYDHETDQGEMGRLEERLRQRSRLPSGLIARS
jgi:probable rRNA maturation factor